MWLSTIVTSGGLCAALSGLSFLSLGALGVGLTIALGYFYEFTKYLQSEYTRIQSPYGPQNSKEFFIELMIDTVIVASAAGEVIVSLQDVPGNIILPFTDTEKYFNSWADDFDDTQMDALNSFVDFYDDGVREYTVDQYHLFMAAGGEIEKVFKEPAHLYAAPFSIFRIVATGIGATASNTYGLFSEPTKSFTSWVTNTVPGLKFAEEPISKIIDFGQAAVDWTSTAAELAINLLIVDTAKIISSEIADVVDTVIPGATNWISGAVDDTVVKPAAAVIAGLTTAALVVTAPCR